jgi:2-C-methyl-D-erythritol 4-phosphate cytidylyltransferase
LNTAVIVAAGRGERFGAEKQLAWLAGRPVLWHSVSAFVSAQKVDRIVVVTRSDLISRCRDEFMDMGLSEDRLTFISGGSERQESVRAGLQACPPETRIVLVHDGARPLITSAQIDRSVDHLEDFDGLIFASPICDTIKEVEAGVIVGTRRREKFWRAETPQLFPFDTLRRAHRQAVDDGFIGTDDASLVERLGGRVGIFPSPGLNLKITTANDLDLAEHEFLRRRK